MQKLNRESLNQSGIIPINYPAIVAGFLSQLTSNTRIILHA